MPPRLILASASPRRRELLSILGVRFEVVPANVDEIPADGEPPADFVRRAAADKGAAVAGRVPGAVVLAADTIVALGERILGKPGDRDDAIRMLEQLSGRDHVVYTAVSVTHSDSGERHAGLDATRVWFDPIDRDAIEDYLDRESVLDKAGAYGIQGFAAVFIPRIEGNYGTVMGLPLPLTRALLARHGLT